MPDRETYYVTAMTYADLKRHLGLPADARIVSVTPSYFMLKVQAIVVTEEPCSPS